MEAEVRIVFTVNIVQYDSGRVNGAGAEINEEKVAYFDEELCEMSDLACVSQVAVQKTTYAVVFSLEVIELALKGVSWMLQKAETLSDFAWIRLRLFDLEVYVADHIGHFEPLIQNGIENEFMVVGPFFAVWE